MREKLVKRITSATRIWYNLIEDTRHKDRDNQFHITIKWEYGNEPVYEVHHTGFIGDDIWGEFSDEISAYQYLLRGIMKNTKGEKETIELALEMMNG